MIAHTPKGARFLVVCSEINVVLCLTARRI